MAVGVALVVGACGGGDGGDAAGTNPGSIESSAAGTGSEEPKTGRARFVEFGPEVVAQIGHSPLAERLATELGPEDAFAALLYALERGYDAKLILAAAEAGKLQLDGTIVADGQVVEPASPPEGVIVLPVGFRAAPEPVEPMALYEQLRAMTAGAPADDLAFGAAVLSMLIGLMRTGYSVEQITELLILGDGRLVVNPGLGCAFFSMSGGNGGQIEMSTGETRQIAAPANAGEPECREQIADVDEAPTDGGDDEADERSDPDVVEPVAGMLLVQGELLLNDLGDIDEVVENDVIIRLPEDGGEFEGSVLAAHRIVEERFFASVDADEQLCIFDIVVTMTPAGTYDPVFETLEVTDSSINFAPEVVEGCVDADLSAFAFVGEVMYSSSTFDGTTLTMQFDDGSIEGTVGQ